MEVQSIIEKLKNKKVEDSKIKGFFKELEAIFSRNPLLLTNFMNDFIELLDEKDYQLFIIDILEYNSIKNPEIFDGSINLLIISLKNRNIQLDILSIIQNILENDPHILIDEIAILGDAAENPDNIKIKSDLKGIIKDLKHKFPEMIIDPIDSLIREIENKDIDIINIYKNLQSNYGEVIKKNIEETIDDPIELLITFSNKTPEIFRESIEYLINSLDNEDLQLYTIDILKNIAKKEPFFFENHVHRLIQKLDNPSFQFYIMEIIECLKEYPRLFQSEIKSIIEKLDLKYLKLDLIRLLRDFSETNPEFFKNKIKYLLNYLDTSNVSFRINILALIRNISYDEPLILKSSLNEIINLLSTENIRLEVIEILKNLGRKIPDIYDGHIKKLLEYIKHIEIRNQIIDIIQNISIRFPELLFNYDIVLFKLLDEDPTENLIDIIRNILKIQSKELNEHIPEYLENLNKEIAIKTIYPEIRKILKKNQVIIKNNKEIFLDFIKDKYYKIKLKEEIRNFISKFSQFPSINDKIESIYNIISKNDAIFKDIKNYKIEDMEAFIILIDYIINCMDFIAILEKYEKLGEVFELEANRKMLYELLISFKKGLNKINKKLWKFFD